MSTRATSSDSDSLSEISRGNLYHILGRAFSSPVDMKESEPEMLRLLLPDLSGDLASRALGVVEAWEEGLRDVESLLVAYARCFLGPFEVLAPPYASHYLEVNQKLMGDVSHSVSRHYTEAGLAPGPGPREAPDHVAVEFEFMYYLTYQIVKTGKACWHDRRTAFRSNHLRRWLPPFAEQLARAEEHPFYNRLAELIPVLLEQEQRLDRQGL